jgi:hypothetical protein
MGDCQTCQQLWRKYTSATREHVSLENKLRMATLRCDYDELRNLNGGVEAAHRERVRLRETIQLHDAAVHAGVVKVEGASCRAVSGTGGRVEGRVSASRGSR